MSSKRKQAYNILDETDGNISNEDLAEKVGYSNRSGAYKARKKWEEMNEETLKNVNNGNTETVENTQEKEANNSKNNKKNGSNTGNARETETESKETNETDKQETQETNSVETTETENTETVENTQEKEANNANNEQPTVKHSETAKQSGGISQSVIDNPSNLEIDSENVEQSEDVENSQMEVTENNKEFVEDLEENTNGGTLEIDEDILAQMIGQPFSIIGSARGHEDLWELTDEEKETNAQLLKQYCDENNIDLDTGTLLAMNLGSQIGGRVMMEKQISSDNEDEAIEEKTLEEREENSGETNSVETEENNNNNNTNEEEKRNNTNSTNGNPELLQPESW